MEREKYSVVFRPPDNIIKRVAAMKSILGQEIGWYHSMNSEAHITICEFHANQMELVIVKRYLLKFCEGVKSSEVVFDHMNYFPSTLFIAPDELSSNFLKRIMVRFNASFPILKEKLSNTPHVSIGRKLDESKITLALKLFQDDFSAFVFNCDSIFLRKFDETIRQFVAIDCFPFGNPEQELLESNQFSLFD